jgi:hypothetical protein
MESWENLWEFNRAGTSLEHGTLACSQRQKVAVAVAAVVVVVVVVVVMCPSTSTHRAAAKMFRNV